VVLFYIPVFQDFIRFLSFSFCWRFITFDASVTDPNENVPLIYNVCDAGCFDEKNEKKLKIIDVGATNQI